MYTQLIQITFFCFLFSSFCLASPDKRDNLPNNEISSTVSEEHPSEYGSSSQVTFQTPSQVIVQTQPSEKKQLDLVNYCRENPC